MLQRTLQVSMVFSDGFSDLQCELTYVACPLALLRIVVPSGWIPGSRDQQCFTEAFGLPLETVCEQRAYPHAGMYVGAAPLVCCHLDKIALTVIGGE